MLKTRLSLAFAIGLGVTGCSDEDSPEDDDGRSQEEASADSDSDSDQDDSDDDDTPPPSSMRDSGGPVTMLDAKVGTEGDAAKPDGGTTPPAPDAGGLDAGGRPPRVPGTPGASMSRSVTVGGATRTFQLYIPSGLDKATAVPFISMHHGFTMTGKIMEDITSWKKIAEREGFVIAFPDGGDGAGPWNVGEGVCSPGDVVSADPSQDDFGFVKAMIDSANADQTIDRVRVFVGGFSMGGFFANNVGCKGRDFVRAVAAHSSGTYAGECPGKPVPVLMIHGDADGLISYPCGTEAYEYWIERNGCGTEVESEAIKGGSCEWNQGCPAGQELGLCTLNEMDHGWAGAPTLGPGAWLTGTVEGAVNGEVDNKTFGGGDTFEDAAELMWKFFKRYL